ncbi:LysM peptidoglycan-binding domain-containing protein [[Limnothrix rosea] IAM M-220]|uniref:CIS tube protein n=1 Tax=[Limnothrix rosea] IAM M-220 TaxID=454133 RepID=UPI0009658737|nr:LysM peptidoglycan-binding domain-containing protein [[Limnothrix rosea] IAM M-220]OKH18098.1 peptidoglycan-binding LysM [[Limnothrix rosea] IAM M-220]
MALAKLRIIPETDIKGNFLSTNAIYVFFNPQSLSFDYGGWDVNRKGNLVQGSSSPDTLSLELFYDTTLYTHSPKLLRNSFPRPVSLFGSPIDISVGEIPPENVQKYTKKIVELTVPSIPKSGDPKRPPLCKIYWGNFSDDKGLVFDSCFVKSVKKELTHFWADGTPVRAKLNCEFQAWTDADLADKKLNPVDDPVRIVKRGETLSSISEEEYGDPHLWRIIADENKLLNPRKLKPGTVLTIPPLAASSTVGGGG